MNADLIQLNQVSLMVCVVALLGIVRERTIIPYILVVLGSFLHGSIAAALIASLVVWVRFDGSARPWLRFKDSLALFFIISASALPEPYREFMICFGVLGLSLHFASGKLGVVPALLLTHLYLGEGIPLEFVLGASAAYIVISEALRLAKSPHEQRVLRWIELPAVLGILYPFLDAMVRWSADEVLLGVGIGVAAIIVGVVIWIHLKKPDFRSLYLSVHEGSVKMLQPIGSLVSNEIRWMKPSLPEPSLKLNDYFDRLFWGLVAAMGVWALLLLIYRGGLA